MKYDKNVLMTQILFMQGRFVIDEMAFQYALSQVPEKITKKNYKRFILDFIKSYEEAEALNSKEFLLYQKQCIEDELEKLGVSKP